MSYTDLKSVAELQQLAFSVLARLQSGIEEVVRLDDALECAKRVWDHQQARIDELMMEYCPDEMTPEQLKEYVKHLKPIDPDEVFK